MKIWQEDVSALFEATGISVAKPVLACFGKATYEFDKNPKANWLYYAFLAFIKLAAIIRKPELVVTVGAGSALDGIAIYETFRPRQMRLIDVNPAVIEVARTNLQNYFVKVAAEVQWDVVLGNLCSPLQPESADVIYANIPTLPGNASQVFVGMNSSSFFDPAWVRSCSVNLAANYLGLQHEFLCQARVALKPGGSALVALGVRTSASLVEELFLAAGFGGYEALVFDLKEQSQLKAVASSYAKQEREAGLKFEFYREPAAQNQPGANLSLQKFKESLRPWMISASEALRLARRGEKVYHVIAILRGQK